MRKKNIRGIWESIILPLEEKILTFDMKEKKGNSALNRYLYAINKIIKNAVLKKDKEILITRRNFIKIFYRLTQVLDRQFHTNQRSKILKKTELLKQYSKYLKKNKSKIKKYNCEETYIQAPKYNLLANVYEYISNEIYNFTSKKLNDNENTEDHLSVPEIIEIVKLFLEGCKYRIKEKEFMGTKKMRLLWNKYAQHMCEELIKLNDQSWTKKLHPKKWLELRFTIEAAKEGLKPFFIGKSLAKSSLFKPVSKQVQADIPELKLSLISSSSLFVTSPEILENEANMPLDTKATTNNQIFAT